MTTKPRAKKFRIRRSGSTAPDGAASAMSQQDAEPSQPSSQASNTAPEAPSHPNVDSPAVVASETDLDAIRKEGLTGRQLRMARRVAQKNGLAVTSDFDAVRQLRQRGIDPFQRANVLELVAPDTDETNAAVTQMQGGGDGGAGGPGGGQIGDGKNGNGQQGRVQLPQTVVRKPNLPSTELGQDNPAERRAGEIRKIQQDIARRRRKNLISLFSRLAVFVVLPTLMAGWYFFVIATPMYETKSEFVIQQAESQASTGFGGLFQGTGLATQSDAVQVQSFLNSRSAMQRLNDDHGFMEHFQNPDIDGIQRLDPDATKEEGFKLYQDMVQIGYDPTEGILKLQVIAADPLSSQQFSEALIGYAEEEVDQLTQRMRNDQMSNAVGNFEAAETARQEALQALTDAQSDVEVVDPVAAIGALQQRISALELSMDQKQIELASIQAATRPNQGRVAGITAEIDRLKEQITALRGQVSGLAVVVARLREAEENYSFAVERVTAAQAAMDTSRIEADRQVRFLLVSVPPVAPDEPSYPRAFEDTLLAFLLFAGIYLMLSLTASILREQVSS